MRIQNLAVLFPLILSAFTFAQSTPGVVYTATNSASGNAVLVYSRNSAGALSPAGAFQTSGLGSGTGLGNQGGVVLTENGRFLLVVNAGSDSVSSFRTRGNGLQLADTVSAQGRRPISIAVSGDLIYVLNAGGSIGAQDGIAGFRLDGDGKLNAIPNSVRPLSSPSTGPAQISFDQSGETLIVTEKNTNLIDVFALDEAGTPSSFQSFPASAATPFGFAVGKRDIVVVSNARGGAAGASAITSLKLSGDSQLSNIGNVIDNGETAVCWVALTRDGQFAFVTNTGSNTISSLRVGASGLTLIEAVAAQTSAAPIDLAITNDDRFAVVLNSGADTLQSFAIASDGKLTLVNEVATAPTANGVAAK